MGIDNFLWPLPSATYPEKGEDIDRTLPSIKGLTEEDVAAESSGKMPPQAIMRLSTTWEMRCMLLWTNTTFSLLFTKSRIVFVE